MATQAQQSAYNKLLDDYSTLTGFGYGSEENRSTPPEIRMANERIPNFYGLVVLPTGEVVDQRQHKGKSWVNKMVSQVAPVMKYVPQAIGAMLTYGASVAAAAGAAASAGEATIEEALTALASEGYEVGDLAAAVAGLQAEGYQIAAGTTIEALSESGALSALNEMATSNLPTSVPEGLTETAPEVAQGAEAVSKVSDVTQLAKEAGMSTSQATEAMNALTDMGYDLSGVDAVTKVGFLGKVASALSSGSTILDAVKLAATLTPVIAGAFADTGDVTATQTQTTSKLPEYTKATAEDTWNQFVDDFFGTGNNKSLEDRIKEDTAYSKSLSDTYVNATSQAMKPYTDLLTSQLSQSQAGQGLFTPTNITFSGGQGGASGNLFSFVPKSNMAQANQQQTTAQNLANTNAGLAELANTQGQQYMPNQAANLYSDKLQELMKYLQSGTQTTTGSATTGGSDTWTNILKGLTTAAQVANTIYPWQKTA